MNRSINVLVVLVFLMSGCQKEAVNADLRTELVGREFNGNMKVGAKSYKDTSFKFTRGGIRDPYYLVSLEYDGEIGSGLIEIFEDQSFGINLQLVNVNYVGKGYMKSKTVYFSAKSLEDIVLEFEGKRTD